MKLTQQASLFPGPSRGLIGRHSVCSLMSRDRNGVPGPVSKSLESSVHRCGSKGSAGTMFRLNLMTVYVNASCMQDLCIIFPYEFPRIFPDVIVGLYVPRVSQANLHAGSTVDCIPVLNETVVF